MKRLGSLGAFCPNSTDEVTKQGENPMFEEEKKRRLRVDQVKALEKNFEVENKLEPDRKVKLAQDLGLQPRQVAVWFQNRRARWRTKRLETDYGLLKANFDAMKNNYEILKRDNQALLKEIDELKSKVNNDDTVSDSKEEIILVSKTEEKSKAPPNSNNSIIGFASVFNDLKDSDSSAILNEDQTSSTAANQFMDDITNCVNISFQFSESKTHDEFVKIEEHNLFGNGSFFADDQPPTLHWYSSHDWN